jgi:hypothetical protein
MQRRKVADPAHFREPNTTLPAPSFLLLTQIFCALARYALVVSPAHVSVASQALKQSLYHALMRAPRSSSYWLVALLVTPFDGDECGRLDCAPDWALAPLQVRSNANAQALGKIRLAHRYFKPPLSANAIGLC